MISADGGLKSPTFGNSTTSPDAPEKKGEPATGTGVAPRPKPKRSPPRPKRPIKLPQVETNNIKIDHHNDNNSSNNTTSPTKTTAKKRSAKADSPSEPSPKASKVADDIPWRPAGEKSGNSDEEEEEEEEEEEGEEEEPLTPDPAESSLNVDELGNLLDEDGNIIGHRDAKVKSAFTPKLPSSSKGKDGEEANEKEGEAEGKDGGQSQRENAASGKDGKPSDIFLDIKSTVDCIQIVMRIPTSGFGGGVV